MNRLACLAVFLLAARAHADLVTTWNAGDLYGGTLAVLQPTPTTPFPPRRRRASRSILGRPALW